MSIPRLDAALTPVEAPPADTSAEYLENLHSTEPGVTVTVFDDPEAAREFFCRLFARRGYVRMTKKYRRLVFDAQEIAKRRQKVDASQAAEPKPTANAGQKDKDSAGAQKRADRELENVPRIEDDVEIELLQNDQHVVLAPQFTGQVIAIHFEGAPDEPRPMRHVFIELRRKPSSTAPESTQTKEQPSLDEVRGGLKLKKIEVAESSAQDWPAVSTTVSEPTEQSLMRELWPTPVNDGQCRALHQAINQLIPGIG